VKQFRASGLTQKAFCAHKNIKHAHLRYLLYRKNNLSKKATTFVQSSQPALFALTNSPFQPIGQRQIPQVAAVPSFTVASPFANLPNLLLGCVMYAKFGHFSAGTSLLQSR
jgi:hypothetical protein